MSRDDGRNDRPAGEAPGPIGYMARNGVAANLLMFFMLAAGLASVNGLVQEGFPVLDFEAVEVLVAYPGATPDEVEESIVLKIEEQVAALDGVREVTAVAAEGLASVIVGLRSGADVGRAVDDVESAVNRIRTFPALAERPEVRRTSNRQSVIRLVLYGDVPERALKELGYRTEDEIAALPEVSHVETSGVRPYEVSIEAPLRRLRSLGLTLEDISAAVRGGALDLSAGRIETRDADVRVRTTGRSHTQQDFEDIVVLGRGDGTLVRLGDVAAVRDGFQDVDLIARYDGQRAAFVEVYRAAGEQVIAVAEAVEAYVEQSLKAALPAGVAVEVWYNDAEVYRARRDLLLGNGVLGFLLVLVALTLFLEIRTAGWVVVGMIVSFVGALAVALSLDVSINTTSLVAFILAVGIVVDDAIVVADHVHAERLRGGSGTAAAIRGTRRIARPLVFAVLTTVAAFMPLLFVPGAVGGLVRDIPTILICVLVFSLIESLLVLPRHLAHLPEPGEPAANRVERFFSALQAGVDRRLNRFVEGPLDRGLRLTTRHPAPVIAGCIGAAVVSIALVPAGIVDLIFVPSVESDVVIARLEMPEGTPAALTDRTAREVEAAGLRAVETLSASRGGDAEPLLIGVGRAVGMEPHRYGGAAAAEASLRPPAHVATVEFKLLDSERRDVRTSAVVQAWRDEAAALTGAGSLTVSAELLDLGAPVLVELSHPDPGRLGPAVEALADHLRTLRGTFDVRSDLSAAVQEVRVELRPEARTLGLTLEGLARQVRSAFFGAEALRMQRGREDVAVYVRLPAADRDSIADVEGYLVRVPAGGAVPLSRVAEVSLASSPRSIPRRDGRRTVTVSADVDPTVTTGNEVNALLADAVLPGLAAAHPGLTYAFGGEQRLQAESVDSLLRGFALALLLIYALLAVPLRSYTRPLIIMAVIPLGVIGAILGHLVMGIALSASSIWGVLGLSGVAVNDSLMMVDFIDERRRRGAPPREAIVAGAKARFRPIFVTSLTTFLGFTPLIFERSVQAQILVPIAVSMGFGLVFATIVLMSMVPALMTVCIREDRRDGAAVLPEEARA